MVRTRGGEDSKDLLRIRAPASASGTRGSLVTSPPGSLPGPGIPMPRPSPPPSPGARPLPRTPRPQLSRHLRSPTHSRRGHPAPPTEAPSSSQDHRLPRSPRQLRPHGLLGPGGSWSTRELRRAQAPFCRSVSAAQVGREGLRTVHNTRSFSQDWVSVPWSEPDGHSGHSVPRLRSGSRAGPGHLGFLPLPGPTVHLKHLVGRRSASKCPLGI